MSSTWKVYRKQRVKLPTVKWTRINDGNSVESLVYHSHTELKFGHMYLLVQATNDFVIISLQ